MTHDFDAYPFEREHCLSISDFHRIDIERLLDLGAHYLNLDEQKGGNRNVLRGKTLINLFFENSTRTEKSFELAGKRLGADVISMQVASSSVKKGETLLDTAATLNAMNPDLLVVRHGSSGAPALLSQKVSCSVINAGDGMHEHPTQALLDALTLRQAFSNGKKPRDIGGLQIAICGDILHSRVARSNVQLLNLLGANVRLIGPPTLIPTDADRWGVEVFHDMETGLKGCDVVMMLRLQLERMKGAFVASSPTKSAQASPCVWRSYTRSLMRRIGGAKEVGHDHHSDRYPHLRPRKRNRRHWAITH